MFHYSAYNLAIRSDICLPELPSAPPGDGLYIRLAPANGPIAARAIEWQESPSKQACFYFPGVARFQVYEGREVTITPAPEADHSIFRLYVQGMMLASALHQRGHFVLHASVIDLDGRAIGLMGPIGAGKSTFASAFLARGHSILADDNAVLDLRDSVPAVLPGFPNLKVYPEIARSLGHDGMLLKPMHESQVKQALSVADRFCGVRRPLDALYVLDRDVPPGISQLSPVECMTELIRHSVPTRWSVRGDGHHLKMCAELAKRVPVFRVRTFASLHEIAGIAEGIESHPARGQRVASDQTCCAAY